ncbi:carbohydrate kinase family protein [Galbitalea sp. SE-J8]|uniref:carbohydrate kinase family protein n=1 Tax=Galbitalea sp. SE-J8 TaxID=3054952 RepID=UPI00259CB883|nr:carbohydrate kinase family protein [Galbitalea sp. SE-J8]MDM4762064.1 carbohydrate kinase family protein [Galbitalea sp. SE-J8]
MTIVIVAGHVCLDLAPDLRDSPAAPDESYLRPGHLIEVGSMGCSAGGSVANTGRELQRLGVAVTAVGRVGDDALAASLRDVLDADGIDASGLAVDADSSTSYSIVVEPPGRDRTFWHHIGANARFTGDEVDPRGAALVHLGYPSLLPATLAHGGAPIARLFERARRAGATTSLDLAVVDSESSAARTDWRALLASIAPVTDILSPSFDDLSSALRLGEPYSPARAEALVDELLAAGVGVVAISAGAGGLHLGAASVERLLAAGPVLAGLAHDWAGRRLHRPAVSAPDARSTNGAGDASTAGLLAAMLRGESAERAMRLAQDSALHAMGAVSGVSA